MTKSKRLELALVAAGEYRDLFRRCDYVLAEQTLRTIYELVGTYNSKGELTLPDDVSFEMGWELSE